MKFCEKSDNFHDKGFFYSVNAALEGVVHTLRFERNMRIHFLFGFIVLIGGVYFNFTAIEFMILCFAVTLVLVAELFNTVIEHAVDLIKDEYHPTAKIVKDVAAGAVFVSSLNSLVVGYLLFFRRIGGSIGKAIFIVKQSPWHITLITLLVVIGLVLLIKIIRKERFLLRGGMPSGHSAVAFAIWMILTLFTESTLVCFLVFFLALFIARSRKVSGVHTSIEIVAGSLIGSIMALLIYQILS
ncbi:MAG: diacylglycerol kinase [Candidatus Omnitrophota bacterium]